MELPIYREIWDHYCAVDFALTHVRIASGAGQTTDGRSHTEAHQAFQSAPDQLRLTVRKHEPFFAPEVNQAVLKANLPLRAIAVVDGRPATRDTQAAGERDSKEVVEAMDVLRRAIRKRLHSDATTVDRFLAPPPAKNSVMSREK